MTMRLTIDYVMEDGETGQVVADQRDVAQWEIQPFGCPLPDLEGRMMLGTRWLCWHALYRTGGTGRKWAEWSNDCIEATPVMSDEPDALDPGQREAPDEPSSASVSVLESRSPRSRRGTREI